MLHSIGLMLMGYINYLQDKVPNSKVPGSFWETHAPAYDALDLDEVMACQHRTVPKACCCDAQLCEQCICEAIAPSVSAPAGLPCTQQGHVHEFCADKRISNRGLTHAAVRAAAEALPCTTAGRQGGVPPQQAHARQGKQLVALSVKRAETVGVRMSRLPCAHLPTV